MDFPIENREQGRSNEDQSNSIRLWYRHSIEPFFYKYKDAN